MRDHQSGGPQPPEHEDEWLARWQQRARALGFSQIGVAGVDLREAEPGLLAWLAAGMHGSMDYMARHGLKRARPAELLPGTLSVITARMDYLPGAPGQPVGEPLGEAWRQAELARLQRPGEAVVSLYARGRDYHKVLRQRLQRLADELQAELGPLGARVFTDSAPVLEVELATRSGLGWRGKHTLTLSREAGSMFFLGEIFVDRALPASPPVSGHCGACTACITGCPTGAIVAPGRVDARRCLSYLSIEHEGAIPVELRRAMGNRLYGCDDCQLLCPWNKFARSSPVGDFQPRPHWADMRLGTLWAWGEAEFLQRTEGSAIRRIGWARWRRNLIVVCGNALADERLPEAEARALRAALTQALHAGPEAADPVLCEHLHWALSSGSGGQAL